MQCKKEYAYLLLQCTEGCESTIAETYIHWTIVSNVYTTIYRLQIADEASQSNSRDL